MTTMDDSQPPPAAEDGQPQVHTEITVEKVEYAYFGSASD